MRGDEGNRGVLHAIKGKEMVVGDYNGIGEGN